MSEICAICKQPFLDGSTYLINRHGEKTHPGCGRIVTSDRTITLPGRQLFQLAQQLMLEAYPDSFNLEIQPSFIRANWLHEAQNAVDGYNAVKRFLESGVIE